MWWWGARRRRHWPVGTGNGSSREYSQFGVSAPAGMENGGGCGWGRRTNMHPVGYLKEQPLCGKPRGWSSMPGMTWPLIPVTWWRLVGGVVVVGWSLVENCTVDASILFSV